MQYVYIYIYIPCISFIQVTHDCTASNSGGLSSIQGRPVSRLEGSEMGIFRFSGATKIIACNYIDS